MEGKKLNVKFEEVQRWQDTQYVIYCNGDVELLAEHGTIYPIITAKEILKLAEILREEEKC